MTQKKPLKINRAITNCLEEAEKAARLENAQFSPDSEEDARIKKAVASYLTTWVAGRIALCIMAIEGDAESMGAIKRWYR